MYLLTAKWRGRRELHQGGTASIEPVEEALRYLQAAYDQRDGALLFVENNPESNRLGDEPAYRDVLARMNLPV
jgi:hypothetical protein